MRFGIWKESITPEYPVWLEGQNSRTHKSEGILDKVYVTGIVIEDEEDHLLSLLSYDLVELDRGFSDELIKAVKENCEIENVITSFTHTHSAPSLQTDPVWSVHYAPEETVSYREEIKDRSILCIRKAKQQLADCEVYFAKKKIDGIYSCRSDIRIEGDKDFFVIQFKNGENVLGNLVQFACHGTILGPENYLISSDLQGRVRDFFNETYGGEAYVMQGAAGDMGNRQYRKGNDEKELIRTAKELCDQLKDLSFEKLDIRKMKIRSYSYGMNYDFDLKDIEKRFRKNKETIFKLDPDIPSEKDQIKLLKTEQIWYSHLLKNRIDQGSLMFDGWIIDMKELIIVTAPCELSSVFAIRIKEAFKNKRLIVWPYTYYSNGYLIQKEEFGKSFESSLSMMRAGQAEEYCDHLISLLRKEIG